MTKQPTLTKADLIEEVLKVTELPRKESETIVETKPPDSDYRRKPSKRPEKIRFAGSGGAQAKQRQPDSPSGTESQGRKKWGEFSPSCHSSSEPS